MIVVCGVPRSGTTWIGKVLSWPDHMFYCHEPDNEHHNLLGYACKQRLPRFPYIPPGDPHENGLYHIFDQAVQGNYLFGYDSSSLLIKKVLGLTEGRIEQELAEKQQFLNTSGIDSFYPRLSNRIRNGLARGLYRLALLFKGPGQNNQRLLIKSVHCFLALPYIQHHFGADIVLVLRHPANIVLSHRKLGNPDIHRNIFTQEKLVDDYLAPFKDNVTELDHPLERAGAQVGAFYFVLNRQLADHPDWLVLRHEQFCLEPHGEFKTLFKRLGVCWSDEVAEYITDLNKEGEGYDYRRIAKKQIDKWKRTLTDSQIEQIRTGYRIFPPTFYKTFWEE